ncbi:TonB-dependent siderophore receptor, partial [uncultured Megasphaera sp.]|uniref:TonB-dependent receptor plug domain-containing protein n=1 Tax=uncultured Megasphaera sp. TaxID=165188 RepID=UPI002658A433
MTTKDVVVEANAAKEAAKYESQQTTIITSEDIEKKQAKSVEDIIFHETGLSRSVDAMGRVTVSIRGAEPRHTLILIDGQPVMGDFAKYSGQADELQRLGTENVDHIEIIQGAASAKYGSDAIGGVINVVTKKAAKTPGFQVNAEGRRTKGDGDLFPYQNVFLRADSGQVGKARFSVYGSKREILPVYSKNSYSDNLSGSLRNSLRYYGDIKNIGFLGSYDIDERNKIDVTLDKTTEDMERLMKQSDAAPQTLFKRDLDRNRYSLTYTGNNGGSTDWKISYDYTKIQENDVTTSTAYAESKYTGKNTLLYVDDIMHKQYNIKASANTQLNDRHLLTYGFGYSQETGEGSRIKNAPHTTTRYIDPWAYDKNLKETYDSITGASQGPESKVHDYAMSFHENGVPYYDKNWELYGAKNGQGMPAFTEDDWQALMNNKVPNGNIGEFAQQLRQDPSNAELLKKNPDISDYMLVVNYYRHDLAQQQYPEATKFNGKEFNEEYNARKNRQTVGKVTLKKQNFYIGDTWQVNDNTILSPVFRIDHSDLFGSNATFNLGLTHNLGGNQHRRFKANVGTGYTEPGMGELYYSWEMYAGSPARVEGLGDELGRMGYYWIGNPDLKPEKSVNFDIGIEGENGNTSARLNVFHNKIDDYMTTYFTGEIMDFHPGASTLKFIQPPDMIYSFKNIGEAEITGVEAEINHRFNKHWSGKLGYTYLHAVNKSDPDMPDQLLDKPQHKVDIGVTYENAGWTASLWGDYYIHMLDSNAISNNGNYMESDDHTVHYFFKDKSDWTYQKKTFGLWNFLLSKQIDKDSTVYVGVDNLFNHRDDDQAFMERVYKFGVNLKFGPGGETLEKELDKAAGKAVVEDTTKPLDTDWFIQKPFDTEKEPGVEVIGDYRARWNSFTGEIKASEARVTPTASVGSAYKNYLEKAEHGFEQRLRLGLDARIGENTNVKILGSASGMTGVDTMHDVSDSKGLNHQRLDNIDITQHANKWDFSIGRLTEPMGVTGYWFGKEYDGARAVWTSGNTQVRLGYGDFSASTGITDSAYTHATREVFMRAPTIQEWLGYDQDAREPEGIYVDHVLTKEGFSGLYQKLAAASTLAEQKELVSQYLDIIKQDKPDTYNTIMANSIVVPAINTFAWKEVTLTQGDKVIGTYMVMENPYLHGNMQHNKTIPVTDVFDQKKLEETAEMQWQSMSDSLEQVKESPYSKIIDYDARSSILGDGKYTVTEKWAGYYQYTGSQILKPLWETPDATTVAVSKDDFDQHSQKLAGGKDEAHTLAVQSLWNKDYAFQQYYTTKYFDANHTKGTGLSGYTVQAGVPEALTRVIQTLGAWQENNSMPVEALEKQGILLPQFGTVLVKDVIPAIERAAFVQAKHQFGDNFGVQAWYLRSLGDDTHSIRYADERRADLNNTASFDELANVIGLGAKYRFGQNASVSFDWGQNRTDFGRFMNGSTIYTHTAGTSDFSIDGRTMGGMPRFWTVRFDIGRADTDVPGSWNAFADYK